MSDLWTSEHRLLMLLYRAAGPSDESSDNSITIERCAICLQDFEDGDDIITLPCSHFFHSHCIRQQIHAEQQYFKNDRKEKGEAMHSCPTCRYDLGGSAVRAYKLNDKVTQYKRPAAQYECVTPGRGSARGSLSEQASPLEAPWSETSIASSIASNASRRSVNKNGEMVEDPPVCPREATLGLDQPTLIRIPEEDAAATSSSSSAAATSSSTSAAATSSRSAAVSLSLNAIDTDTLALLRAQPDQWTRTHSSQPQLIAFREEKNSVLRTPKWWIQIKDPTGIPHRMGTFTTMELGRMAAKLLVLLCSHGLSILLTKKEDEPPPGADLFRRLFEEKGDIIAMVTKVLKDRFPERDISEFDTIIGKDGELTMKIKESRSDSTPAVSTAQASSSSTLHTTSDPEQTSSSSGAVDPVSLSLPQPSSWPQIQIRHREKRNRTKPEQYDPDFDEQVARALKRSLKDDR